MEVKSTLSFNFSHVVEGINYGFTITADTRETAVSKLLMALSTIVEELKNLQKAGTKSN